MKYLRICQVVFGITDDILIVWYDENGYDWCSAKARNADIEYFFQFLTKIFFSIDDQPHGG